MAYAAIIVAGLFVACYRAWDEQKLEKEKVLAELAKSSRITSGDWKELAARFEKIANADVSAQWTHWSHGNRNFFYINGTRESVAICEELCRLAGTMLAKSPYRVGRLPRWNRHF